MNLNIKAREENTYDAIVVGTGISGGWSAKELTENGLETLVLERGRDVKHIDDYPTATLDPWELPPNDQVPYEERKHYEKQLRTGYTIRESTKHWWIRDTDQPYEERKRFDWIRGYHVGGRSIMWGRHSYRLSPMDFEANAREGIAVDWPIRYEDLEPWYSHVEKFAGICGEALGLPQLPDSEFLPPMELNCVEEALRESMAETFDRVLTTGRVANLTRSHQGRGSCMYRNLCSRGCPYGAYFSSNASTLPAAERTGNMTLRPHSIVNSVMYDEETGKATGVRVVDAESGEMYEYYARIIFLNASTVNSTSILMNSTSDRFPDGMGNDSGELGHNMMDHHFRVGANGEMDGFEDRYYYGRRPNGFYIPRFRNINGNDRDYLRGFGYQGSASREGWHRGVRELAIGSELKNLVSTPGKWTLGMTAFGEMLPDHSNRMWLNHDETDKWGQPTVVFDVEFKENEYKMREDMKNDAAEMLEAAGMKNVSTYDDAGGPGLGIHEMGTARMGRDPQTSVLGEWNQIHTVPNVFITDGSCMTSAACQNPSLTYMALSARAANYAAEQIKKGDL
ncbi:GMC family oxidoreductase [Rhodohalobacter sp. SW132]|uniref:GMC oxidoreductase n=1 Tax=Rhodohalobacter sp. SW132 TaxID=2293433 RepID=UPI000E26E467|nr:GMC family oxidoreductase [Rhodohalobacter sp. SW132]REL38287.1 GMC family oxidoreductase [Rhodohalobacter sp. SW132]